MHTQDLFVGWIAIILGAVSLAVPFSGEVLVRRSILASQIRQRGGPTAVLVVYLLVGFSLIGVGLSLIKPW